MDNDGLPNSPEDVTDSDFAGRELLGLSLRDLMNHLVARADPGRRRDVEAIARFVPNTMGERHNELDAIIERGVSLRRLPWIIIFDIFWDRGPSPFIVPASPPSQPPILTVTPPPDEQPFIDEYELATSDEDMEYRLLYQLPIWFRPTIVVTQAQQKQLGTPEEDALTIMRNWAAGLITLTKALSKANIRLTLLSFSQESFQTIALLRRNKIDLDLVLLPNPTQISKADITRVDENGPVIHQGLFHTEEILRQVMKRIWSAEQYLIIKEDRFLANDKTMFAGVCLRCERARYRSELSSVIANLRGEHLRNLPMGSTTRIELATVTHGDDSDCSICFEECETGMDPAVSHRCYNKAFHPDYLLEWFFSKLSVPNAKMTCPLCRAEISLGLLGEVMHRKMVEMNCL